MRRETMHVSHLGTAFMRQCLRKAGFDTSRHIIAASILVKEQLDPKAFIAVDVAHNDPNQVTFLQAA